MVDGPALPEPGSRLIVRRLELSMPATLIWRDGQRCGLKLDDRVEIDDVVAGVPRQSQTGSLGQLRVDGIQAAIRSGSSLANEPEPLAGLSGDESAMLANLAKELARLNRMLDRIAEQFSEDVHILANHEQTLQSLDIASMIARHLSEVTAAGNKADAIAEIPMHDLRSRLSGTATLK